MEIDLKVLEIPFDYYRPDFVRVDFGRLTAQFDLLIKQHGFNCLIQKNIRCPCVDNSDRHDPYCKNCKGKGKIYVDFGYDILLLYGYNKRWSERSLEVPVYAEEGVANCSFPARLQLMLWDRIKPVFAKSGIQQIYRIEGNSVQLDYDPVELSGVYVWDEETNDIQKIDLDRVKLEDVMIDDKISEEKKLLVLDKEYRGNITVRYYARPFWYVIDLPAEYRGSRVRFMLPEEMWADYPKVATLRRADFIQA